jgi:membrane protein DedA with SNARE-associated domain
VLERLLDLVVGLGDWAYPLIFLGATLESAAFLGLLVPGESLIIFAGFLAALDVLELATLVPLVAAGGVLGDTVGYLLGHRLGRSWLDRYGHRFGVTHEEIARVEGFFQRHGGKTVFFGRFVGFARALTPFLAGSSRMPYRTFIGYDFLGACLWATGSLLIGYFAGASWRLVERWVGRASLVVAVVGLAVVALVWLWRRRARHRSTV